MKTNLRIAVTGRPHGHEPWSWPKAFRAPDVLRNCFVVGNVNATLRRAADCVTRRAPLLPVAVIEGRQMPWMRPALPHCRLTRAGLLPTPWRWNGSVPKRGAPLLIVCGGQHARRAARCALVTRAFTGFAAGVNCGHTELLRAKLLPQNVALNAMPVRIIARR